MKNKKNKTAYDKSDNHNNDKTDNNNNKKKNGKSKSVEVFKRILEQKGNVSYFFFPNILSKFYNLEFQKKKTQDLTFGITNFLLNFFYFTQFFLLNFVDSDNTFKKYLVEKISQPLAEATWENTTAPGIQNLKKSWNSLSKES